MAEPVEFARTIEGLFVKALGAKTNVQLKGALKAAGLDLDLPLVAGYPAADFHRWVEVATAHVYPDLSRAEGLRAMGHRAIPGLEDTVMGRVLLAGLRVVGPHIGLGRIETIFRNTCNYQAVEVKDLSPRSVQVSLGQVYELSSYYQGVFEGVLPLMGLKGVAVTTEPRPPGAVYLLSWQ